MMTLYESEAYSLTQVVANAEVVTAPIGEGNESGTELWIRVPQLARGGFEIVDKYTNKELYIEGAWAELFEKHLTGWKASRPSQDEIESVLSQYAELAQTPLSIH